jgi:hypothetical protein
MVVLCRKEHIKPRRVKALRLTVHTGLPDKIWDAQREALKMENFGSESLRDVDGKSEVKSNGIPYYIERVWIPLYGNLKELIMDEAHKPIHSVHPGSDKMYLDLKKVYW